MTNKHTPGPWHVRYCDDIKSMCMTVITSCGHNLSNIGQYDNEPETIAIVYHQSFPAVGDNRPDEETEANIKLIAAAPDLLRELTNLVDKLEVYSDIFDLTQARAAIDNGCSITHKKAP